MLVVSCTSFACIVSNNARVTPYVACANHTPHHGEEYAYGGRECTLEVWEKGGGGRREGEGGEKGGRMGRRREREGREGGEEGGEEEGEEGERCCKSCNKRSLHRFTQHHPPVTYTSCTTQQQIHLLMRFFLSEERRQDWYSRAPGGTTAHCPVLRNLAKRFAGPYQGNLFFRCHFLSGCCSAEDARFTRTGRERKPV